MNQVSPGNNYHFAKVSTKIYGQGTEYGFWTKKKEK